jgi:hypothetical protein
VDSSITLYWKRAGDCSPSLLSDPDDRGLVAFRLDRFFFMRWTRVEVMTLQTMDDLPSGSRCARALGINLVYAIAQNSLAASSA